MSQIGVCVHYYDAFTLPHPPPFFMFLRMDDLNPLNATPWTYFNLCAYLLSLSLSPNLKNVIIFFFIQLWWLRG